MNPYLIYGQHDDKTLTQMETCMSFDDAAAGVLCADGHLGYSHPIGGVVGYREHLSISGVGFDIGCGNMAVCTDVLASDIRPQIGLILLDIQSAISFGMGRVNNEKVDHPIFDDDDPIADDLWRKADVQPLKQLARNQLGTVGSGNHYVDLFVDEEDSVWIGVHFGSRGLGHKITTKYLELAGAKEGDMMASPALIGADTDLGLGYLSGVELGGKYAYAGREWVVQKVLDILGARAEFTVHNHHNFVWREEHNGEMLWVVRKGATPAFPGQWGFVGGSMGDNAVILRGVESEKSRASLYSTVHGAGRVMSRTDARGRMVKDPVTGNKIRGQGLIRHDEWQEWIRDYGVTVLGSDIDEAPQAYRRLPEVLAAHEGTIEIHRMLRPFGVIMAGAKEFDPYKD